MAIDINGIAHLQLTVARNCGALEFWAQLCAFLNLETLIQGEGRPILHRWPDWHLSQRSARK